jgi:NDP-sugar pyrophosphorylase family protein
MPIVADAIVLCGGAGLRLRSVTGDGPKSLAKIGGRPFLEILLSQLSRHGFRRVILAVWIPERFDSLALRRPGVRSDARILDRIDTAGDRWCVA